MTRPEAPRPSTLPKPERHIPPTWLTRDDHLHLLDTRTYRRNKLAMGGPYLEVFKFATYVSLPLLVMAHYGNPEWYRNNVLPVSNFVFAVERN